MRISKKKFFSHHQKPHRASNVSLLYLVRYLALFWLTTANKRAFWATLYVTGSQVRKLETQGCQHYTKCYNLVIPDNIVSTLSKQKGRMYFFSFISTISIHKSVFRVLSDARYFQEHDKLKFLAYRGPSSPRSALYLTSTQWKQARPMQYTAKSPSNCSLTTWSFGAWQSQPDKNKYVIKSAIKIVLQNHRNVTAAVEGMSVVARRNVLFSFRF